MERRDDSVSTADLATAAHRMDESDELEQAATERTDEGAGGERTEREPVPDTPDATGPEEPTGRDTEGEYGGSDSLLSREEREALTTKWETIQGGFVDEPRQAVTEADGLVAQVMKRLADTFAQERAHLEALWDRGDEVSTEDLRVALQRYREFFRRLLAA
jgi:hypothetical protein